MTEQRVTRAFRPSVERVIQEQFGIVRPVTDARRLLRAGQENTDAWLTARSASIGASEISILMMGDHPYHSRYSLWHVKAHGWGQHGQTDAMERGHLLEPGIARRFAEAHPELIVARPNGALWRDPLNPAITCTPDYLTIDEHGVVAPLECKSDEGGDGWGWGDEDIPAHHWWQVQQQTGVFAAPYGWIARWSSHGYRDYLIPYDHARYSRAGREAAEFLRTVTDGGPMPDVDGHRSTLAVLTDIDPVYVVQPVQVPSMWGDELRALRESRKQIDKQIKGLEARIRAAMDNAPSGFDLQGRVYKRTLTKRRGFTVAPTVIDQIRTREPADEEETP